MAYKTLHGLVPAISYLISYYPLSLILSDPSAYLLFLKMAKHFPTQSLHYCSLSLEHLVPRYKCGSYSHLFQAPKCHFVGEVLSTCVSIARAMPEIWQALRKSSLEFVNKHCQEILAHLEKERVV